jgi:hypothetical protein
MTGSWAELPSAEAILEAEIADLPLMPVLATRLATEPDRTLTFASFSDDDGPLGSSPLLDIATELLGRPVAWTERNGTARFELGADQSPALLRFVADPTDDRFATLVRAIGREPIDADHDTIRPVSGAVVVRSQIDLSDQVMPFVGPGGKVIASTVGDRVVVDVSTRWIESVEVADRRSDGDIRDDVGAALARSSPDTPVLSAIGYLELGTHQLQPVIEPVLMLSFEGIGDPQRPHVRRTVAIPLVDIPADDVTTEERR